MSPSAVSTELDLVRLALLARSAGGPRRPRSPRAPSSRPSSTSRRISSSIRSSVVLADRLRELEVVVEAVLDRRADGDLHAGIQAANGLGEQVRGRVAQHGERVRVLTVARGQDLDRLAVLERRRTSCTRPFDAHEHRLLGELRADRARGVEAGRAVRKFQFRGVGKDHLHQRQEYPGALSMPGRAFRLRRRRDRRPHADERPAYRWCDRAPRSRRGTRPRCARNSP